VPIEMTYQVTILLWSDAVMSGMIRLRHFVPCLSLAADRLLLCEAGHLEATVRHSIQRAGRPPIARVMR